MGVDVSKNHFMFAVVGLLTMILIALVIILVNQNNDDRGEIETTATHLADTATPAPSAIPSATLTDIPVWTVTPTAEVIVVTTPSAGDTPIIEELRLFNADTDEYATSIISGQSVNFYTYGIESFNIEVVTNPQHVWQVVSTFGDEPEHRELGYPYTIFGNDRADYNGHDLVEGLYRLEVEVWDMDRQTVVVYIYWFTFINQDYADAQIIPCRTPEIETPPTPDWWCSARPLDGCCSG